MVETIFRVILIVLIIAIVLAFISTVSLTFNIKMGNYSNVLSSFLSCICYILPFKKLLPIFGVVISVVCFKVMVSIIVTLWQIFPLKG